MIFCQVARAYLLGSPYENMAPLFLGPTVLLVSEEPKAKQMLLALRGSPQIVLLGKDPYCRSLCFI